MKKKYHELSPDEIFLDSTEIPGFSRERLEGTIEKPIPRNAFLMFGALLMLFGMILYSRAFWLQVVRGEELKRRAQGNYIETAYIEPPRGIIYDRRGVELAFNEAYTDEDGIIQYRRVMRHPLAFSHILGFVGRLSEEEIKENNIPGVSDIGKSGIEEQYNDLLRGEPGSQGREYNALGDVISEGLRINPTQGENINLTLDAELQEETYRIVDDIVNQGGYNGGAGIVYSIRDGSVLALVSAPSFDVNAFSRGLTHEEAATIFSDRRAPLFNRALSGAYATGSVIKPFTALAALEENIIDPERELFSSGALTIPDPYNPGRVSSFADNKAHGFVDMRRALQVSSNVYFYTIGGGYGNIQGLGITRMKDWLHRFGFDELTGIDVAGERTGFLPDPEWKKTAHPDNPIWRVGDTYHVSIGQGDLLATPIGIARALSFLATGNRITPHLLKQNQEAQLQYLNISPEHFQVVREGMHRVTQPGGTSGSLSSLPFRVAGKTGTAQTGRNNQVHSWLMTYAPYEDPQVGVVMFFESGPGTPVMGATSATLRVLSWMDQHGGLASFVH